MTADQVRHWLRNLTADALAEVRMSREDCGLGDRAIQYVADALADIFPEEL